MPLRRPVVKRDRVGAIQRRVGRCIRRARERAELTQEEAAAAADIDYKRWQRLELGTVNPTVRTMARAAEACGLDMFEMLRLK